MGLLAILALRSHEAIQDLAHEESPAASLPFCTVPFCIHERVKKKKKKDRGIKRLVLYYKPQYN